MEPESQLDTKGADRYPERQTTLKSSNLGMSEVPSGETVLPIEISGGLQNSTPQQQRSRGNQNLRRRNNQIVTTNSQSYQGECEDIGYILALRSENFDKKVQF